MSGRSATRSGAGWSRSSRTRSPIRIFDAHSDELFMPSVFPPIRAGTIGELAQRLGLDPAALEATVARFNAAVPPGTVRRHAAGRRARPRDLIRPRPTGRDRSIDAAVHRLSAAAGHHLHLSRRARERARAGDHAGRPPGDQPVRRRRDHGRQHPRPGLSRRLRHDDRHRVRPHRRGGGGEHAMPDPAVPDPPPAETRRCRRRAARWRSATPAAIARATARCSRRWRCGGRSRRRT